MNMSIFMRELLIGFKKHARRKIRERDRQAGERGNWYESHGAAFKMYVRRING